MLSWTRQREEDGTRWVVLVTMTTFLNISCSGSYSLQQYSKGNPNTEGKSRWETGSKFAIEVQGVPRRSPGSYTAGLFLPFAVLPHGASQQTEKQLHQNLCSCFTPSPQEKKAFYAFNFLFFSCNFANWVNQLKQLDCFPCLTPLTHLSSSFSHSHI